MFTRLSLRFRVFLFFCLMAVGGAALAGGALWFGWSREPGAPTGPFLAAFLIFAFLNTGLAAGVWLLFDENVAKPINRLAADLRLRAHSGVEKDVEGEDARYLGDLAPAASAVASTLSDQMVQRATDVARETGGLKAETERLAALLTEIPVATILANDAGEIALYDGQAAAVLSLVAPPRLKAPLTDYFDARALAKARDDLARDRSEVSFALATVDGERRLPARLKPLSGEGFLLIIDETPIPLSPEERRPMVYDFDLLETSETTAIDETPLRSLCFVVFDSETTGLSTETDEVVQIAAVRVVNGRIVEGETVDAYVNPGRPIPPASTRVHGVSDVDVADAPDFAEVGRDFHAFAKDAVLVAHNAPFDIAFLRRGAAEMGVEWRNPVLDTVLLSAVCFGETETHTLDALCDRLAIEIPEEARHTAYGDALATAEALVRLLPLLESRSIVTYADAAAACAKHGRLLKAVDLGA